jgi:hypothetical protein
MSLNADLSASVSSILALAPADTTATATQTTGVDTAGWRSAKVVLNLAGITGASGSWTLSLTSSDTVGGSYTAETAATTFVGGAPAAVVHADAGINVWDIDLDGLDSRFIKCVLTKANTISASLLSLQIEAKLQAR